MKKTYLFALCAVMALFSACSSDDGVANEGGKFTEGTGYLAVSINLPTTSAASRANDVFNDGLAKEYKVNNAFLVLFKGTSEENATFFGAFDVHNNPTDMPPANSNIQEVIEHTTAIQLKNLNLTGSEQLYGYVIVNAPSAITVVTDQKSSDYAKMKIKTTNFDGKFADLRDNLTIAGSSVENFIGTSESPNFTMTNTVLSTVDGLDDTESYRNGGKTKTLINITNSIKSTASEALTSRAYFRVERAVAKVTLTPASKLALGTINLLDDKNEAVGTLSAQVTGWQLVNTSNSSYLGRHWLSEKDGWLKLKSFNTGLSAANPYRFAGNQVMIDASGRYYRTYYCTCPTGNSLNKTIGTYKTGTGETNPLYCFENTMDVDVMTTRNTTMALVEVTFSTTDETANGQAFYTRNNDGYFYTVAAIDNAVKNYVMNIQGYGGTLVVTPTTDAVTKKVTFAVTNDGAPISDTHLGQVNSTFSVYEYTGHKAYYYVLIKHFGDDLTPWPNLAGTTTNEVYPISNRDANYLGRYGVVRNNWYDINVTGVGKIGDVVPNPPTDKDIPDDQENSYLAASIHVLSWAKRVQNETLK